MKTTYKLRHFLLLAGSSLLAVSSASAADGTWSVSAGAATHNWTDTAMWTSGTIANGADFTANFTGVNITGAKIVALNGTDRTIGNITFTDATTASHDLTISGNILTLDRTDATAPQINVTSRTLTISSQISGSDGLTKIGAGTLLLNNALNNYTGGTTISAGAISITADAHLGNSAGGITFNGGTLVIPAGNTISSSRNITVNDGIVGTVGAASNGNGGSFTHNGNLLGGTTSTFVYRAPNDNRLTLNGSGGFSGTLVIQGFAGVRDGVILNNVAAIADTAAPIKVGVPGAGSGTAGYAGNLTFGDAISGALSFNNRWIEMGNSMQLVNANTTAGETITFTKPFVVTATTASTLYLAGVSGNGMNVLSGGGISDGPGAGVVSLNLNGAPYGVGGATANWAIGGINTYSGTTKISAGTLRLDNALAMQNSPLDTTGSVAGGATAGLRTTVTTLTLGGLTGNKNFAASGGVFSTTSGGYGSVTALTLNPGTGANHSYAGVIANGAAGMTLTKTGAGTQTLSNINTYTGGTTISDGTLTLGHATDTLANTGAINVNGGTLALGGNSDTVGAVTLSSGSITGSGTLTGTGSAYDVRSGSVSAKLGGAVGLTKTTGGTVTLSGENTYSGTTTISAGTLALSGSNNILTDTHAVNIDNAAGIFDIAAINTSETIGSLAGVANSSVVLGGKNLTVGDANNTTYAGVISGTLGSLTKQGAGTLTLSGANTYSGTTTVSAGTLLVNSPGSLDASSAVSVNGGTLGGDGTIGGTVTVGADGSVAPGTSAGTLSIVGNLDVSAVAAGTGSGKLKFELAAPGASDKIVVTGTLASGTDQLGFSDFDFSEISGYQAVTLPATHTLITTTGGILDSLDPDDLFGSLPFIAGNGVKGTLQKSLDGKDLELVVAYDTVAPDVNTPSVDFATIDTNSATLGATIVSDGGADITERGTSWSTISGLGGRGDNVLSESWTGMTPVTFSQSRTGLTAGGHYYAWGWADNSVGRGWTTVNGYEFYTEPNQAAAPVVSGLQGTQFTLTWTANSSMSGALVLVKQGSEVTAEPVDGTVYDNANSEFGLGEEIGVGSGNWVVYASSGNTVTITGLTPLQTYYVEVYAYAGSTAGLINYQQDAPIEASATMLTRSLVWDTNTGTSGGQDGLGIWLNANQWWDPGVSANTDWGNAYNDHATIGSGGAGNAITLGTVSAGSVTFGTFTGTYTLQSGTLAISSDLTVGATAGSVSISSQVNGSGGIVKNGSSSTLTLSGSNGYTGGTTISAGAIQITADAHLGNSAGAITLNGGTLVIPAGNNITSSRNITVNDGIVGTMGAAVNDNGGSFTHNGNLLGGTTSTFVFRAPNDNRLTLNGSGGFSGTLVIQGLGGRDGIVLNNAAAIADTNAAIRGGAVGVTSGIGANGLFQLGDSVSGAVTFNNRFIQMASNMTLSNDNTTPGETLTFTKAFDVTATTASTLNLNGDGANGVNVLSGGGISDGVGGAVISLSVNPNLNVPIKRTSNWAIGGNNTYSGTTTISGGTLQVGTGGAGGTLGSGSVANSSILAFNRSDSYTVNNTINGTGQIRQIGSGTTELTAVNGYNGATTINAGALVGVTGGSCANSAVTVANTPGNPAALGVRVTDGAQQWTCSSLTFTTNGVGAELRFTFSVQPSTTLAPLAITGNLVFNGAPRVVVDAVRGGIFPLVVVGGTAPTIVPSVSMPGPFGNRARLYWGGPDKKTLFMKVETAMLILLR